MNKGKEHHVYEQKETHKERTGLLPEFGIQNEAFFGTIFRKRVEISVVSRSESCGWGRVGCGDVWRSWSVRSAGTPLLDNGGKGLFNTSVRFEKSWGLLSP